MERVKPKFKVGDKLFVQSLEIIASLRDGYSEVKAVFSVEVVHILERVIGDKVRWFYVCVHLNEKCFDVYSEYRLYKDEEDWIKTIIKRKKMDIQDYQSSLREMEEDLIEWEDRLKDYKDEE